MNAHGAFYYIMVNEKFKKNQNRETVKWNVRGPFISRATRAELLSRFQVIWRRTLSCTVFGITLC